jgi:endoglucanase
MIHEERLLPRACAMVALVLCLASASWAVGPFVQKQKLGRGVNIIGYDPLWKSRDEARFKVGYFRMLKEAGFSNVRINLHPFRRMNASNDFALPASWWETLDWAVTNALKSGLMVRRDGHRSGNEQAQVPGLLAAGVRAISRRTG